MKTVRVAIVGFGLLLAGTLGAPNAALALDKVTVVIPQNSVFVLNWRGANDAGVFEKHGIDLTVDVRPFGGYLSGLPGKECMASTYSGIAGVLKMTQGLDLAVIGGGLTVIQEIFVPKGSSIKKVEDLRGKRFGVWSTGAGAYKSVRAALIDGYGLDLEKDAQIVQLAPPALFKMLERGGIDAMLNISSFTMKAASEPDKFRPIFSANQYWKEKTGYPVVWSAPLMAWKGWVDEDRDRAKRFSAAVMDSFRWLRKPENFDAAVKKYGTLAGVTSPDVVATYKEWLGAKKIFLADWTQKAADAQWEFLEMAKRHGVMDKVPSKDEHLIVFGD